MSITDRILGAATFFEVLQVPAACGLSEALQKSYRRLAVAVHPDRCSDPRASEAFSKLSEAYEVLSNLELHAQYLAALETDGAKGLHGYKRDGRVAKPAVDPEPAPREQRSSRARHTNREREHTAAHRADERRQEAEAQRRRRQAEEQQQQQQVQFTKQKAKIQKQLREQAERAREEYVRARM
jgi:curved DNA-binding protein CbpA